MCESPMPLEDKLRVPLVISFLKASPIADSLDTFLVTPAGAVAYFKVLA